VNKQFEKRTKGPTRKALPGLNGLVLAGGMSSRMGLDKGLINWHGKGQRYYLADLLNDCCDEVFVSCRPDQMDQMDKNYHGLEDVHVGLGPFGAILSAFNHRSDRAWLIVACDLPLIDSEIIRELVSGRNAATSATAFVSTTNGLPEPLFAIWEPSAYPVLLSYHANGCFSPRKILVDMEAALARTSSGNLLLNVNTPEEARIIFGSG
jgi:molybdopterin-guanine dinucleotide biosynthesis protein A